MSEEIIKTLEYICAKLGIVIDWSSENVWPYVMDILNRYRTMSIIGNAILFVVLLSIMVIAAVLVVKSVRGYIAHDTTWYDHYTYSNGGTASYLSITIWLASCFVLPIVLVFSIFSMNSLLGWAIIPEVKFLEMLKSFV